MLEPAALVLLVVVLPLESVLVIATQVLIPPYIVVLPLLAAIALFSVRSLRELLPGRELTLALVAWIVLTALSLVMWAIDRPPRVGIAASYGAVRASVLRGPLQLAITLAFLAALPLTLALARRRLGLAVGCFVVVPAAVSLYGIYQVVANRLDLPLQNISNDPLVAGRAIPGWRGLLRPYSTFGEPSPFAAYLLGPLALALALAIWPPTRRVRVLATVAGAVIFSAFVLTLSTGSWLALPLLLVIVLVAVAQRRSWWSLLAVPVTAMVVVATLGPLLELNARSVTTASPASQPLKTHTQAPSASKKPQNAPKESGGISAIPSTIGVRIQDSIESGRAGPRAEIQRYQVHLWLAHPVLGVGIGAADLYTAHELHQRSLPSTYGVWSGVLSETGALGTLALLAVVVTFAVGMVRTLRRAPRSPWYPVALGALAGVVAELAAYFWFYERVPADVWALMGLGVLASWRARRDAPA